MRHAAALAIGWALLISCAGSAHAASPSPFPPDFDAELDERFFEQGRISVDKVEAYRSRLQVRLDEVRAILSADLIERGRSPAQAEARTGRKKLVRVYELLLRWGGLLDRLLAEPDPDEARLIAASIVEIDYALRVEGERPLSLVLGDYLIWASIKTWRVDSRTRAKHAGREATNLFDRERGLFYDADDLRAMIESGGDISALDPHPQSSFLRVPPVIAHVDPAEALYEGGTRMHTGARFPPPAPRARLVKLRKSQTKPKFEIDVAIGDSHRDLKLKVGGEIHSEPTLSALMATLGFNVDVPRYVRGLRLDLGNLDVAELRHEWRSYFENRRIHLAFDFDEYFEVGEDEEGRYLIVREGVVEYKPDDQLRIGPWPFGGNGNSGLREVRGLALFSIWIGNTDLKDGENNKLVLRSFGPSRLRMFHVHHDLGHSFGRMISEQLNAFPWDVARRTPTGHIRFNYHCLQPSSLRKMLTYADARWMTRMIGQLRRKQIRRAVELGGWPDAAGDLLVEKLVSRRNQLVEVFGLVGEATPSGPIRILDVDRELTTSDGRVVKGKLVSEFAGSTQRFDQYWEALLGPVLDQFAFDLVALAQATVGQIPELVFDERTVGLPEGAVLELLVNLGRSVTENRQPRSAREYYITADTVRIGARVGAGYVGRLETAYWREYTLLRPAGTRREAQYAGNQILNLTLPWQVARNRLPPEYTLLRESYVDLRGRVITDDLSGGSFPLGAEATQSRARLSRSVISRRGPELYVYRDASNFWETGFRAFFKAVWFRIPFLRATYQVGRRDGRFYVLNEAQTKWPDSTAAALDAAVRRNDFSRVEQIAERTDLRTRFRYSDRWAGLLQFVQRMQDDDREEVELIDPRFPEAPGRAFLQLRRESRRYRSVVDFRESYKSVVRTVVPESDDDPLPPPIEALFIDNDRNTHSRELERGYLHFANTLGAAGTDPLPPGVPDPRERLLPFTPSAHTTNDRWGHVVSVVELGFSPRAVSDLLALEPERFWRALAAELGLERGEIRRIQRATRQAGSQRRQILRRYAPSVVRSVRRSEQLLRRLARAKRSDARRERVARAVGAIEEAVYRTPHGFDPRLLATLRRLLGAAEISVDARLTQPPWREKRLLGGVDVVGHTHAAPYRILAPLIEFRPDDPVALYDMLLSIGSGVGVRPPITREPLEEVDED